MIIKTPITNTYYSKVDHLKNAGIIQGFWSINPKPLNNEDTLKSTQSKGFIRFDKEMELKNSIKKILSLDLNFFSGMESREKLGEIIELANMKDTYEEKGYEFLRLLRDD